MECDWEVEIAPDAPVIEAFWEGFVDLCSDSTRISEVSEAAQFPPLASALVRLNQSGSTVWTVKCDVWPSQEFDPDELDAAAENATSGLGCYIDMLPAKAQALFTLDEIAEWCRLLCVELRARPLRQARVDAVIRRAFLTRDEAGLGTTVYITACGNSPVAASATLGKALALLADSVIALGAPTTNGSKYNRSIVGE